MPMTAPDDSTLYLELQTTSAASAVDLANGLNDWLALGLLEDADMQTQLWIAKTHPAMLIGLERWFQRGLLSEEAVRQICETHLTCAIAPRPTVEPIETVDDFLPFDRREQQPALRSRSAAAGASRIHAPFWRSRGASKGESSPSQRRTTPQITSRLAQMTQALMAELSVLWLLLLGIALVVLSSGVLAARQWQFLPPVGQYGILWLYTLIFGGTGLWLQRRPSVRLTAQALQLVAVLLLPVNVIALDRIGLASTGINIGLGAIALISLTGLVLLIFQHLETASWLQRVNYLGLSYLHWGWESRGWAIAAVYAGVLLTGAITIGLPLRFLQPTRSVRAPSSKLFIGLLIYGLLVLLGRSLFIEQQSITPFALAIGLCGALLAWLAQRAPTPSEESPSQTQLLPIFTNLLSWEWMGGGLILLGWLLAIDPAPAQAIALSGLGFWFFGRRYQRFYTVADWLMLALIGIQLHGLVWAVMPSSIRQRIFTAAIQATGTAETPWALLGLALFPFLAIAVGLTLWAHRDRAVSQGEGRQTTTLIHWLLFGFGTALTGLSLASPATRSLNGLVSTLLLGSITARYLQQGGDAPKSEQKSEQSESGVPFPSPARGSTLLDFTAQPLIYLTHLAAVLTAIAWVDWALPTLTLIDWAIGLIVLMLAEWILSYGLAQNTTPDAPRAIAQASAWHIGLGLTIAIYGLLLDNAITQTFQSPSSTEAIAAMQWGALGLTAPAALTMLGSQAQFPQRRSAQWFSTIGLLALPLLTVGSERWWLWSLAIATALMVVNSLHLRKTSTAAIALGFGIAFVVASLLQGFLGLPPIQGDGWLLVWVSLILALWGLRFLLRHQLAQPSQGYAIAADGWAILLMVGTLLDFSNRALYGFSDPNDPPILLLIALIGLIGAIAFRHWQKASPWTLVCLAIALELLALHGVPLISSTPSAIVVTNIALGLGWIVVRERQLSRSHPSSSNASPLLTTWNLVPLSYALLAFIFRLEYFAPWTGWTTLGIALILTGVGRRSQPENPLCVAGLFVVSAAAYEIALALAPNTWGDSAVLVATVSVALIGLYRLGKQPITTYLRITPQTLQTGAHIHWLIGSVALLTAIPTPIRVLSGLALLSGFLLAAYALEQGRHVEQRSPDVWVYLGIVEACGIVAYLADQALPPSVIDILLPWVGAIAAVIASVFYLAPWETWGWSDRPWRRAAIGLPVGAIALTLSYAHPGSLLIAAACYTLLAQLRHQIRLTYLSIVLANWAIAIWIQDGAIERPMLYASLVGLSLLYLAQVEPLLQDPQQRYARHWVRCLGTGIVCVFALLFHHETGIIPAVVSLAAIFAGLLLRTRAFLYVGTITFLLNAFYQLVILVFAYSILKWIVGLLAGVILIWTAATFETRREQVGTFWRQWFADLRDWQ